MLTQPQLNSTEWSAVSVALKDADRGCGVPPQPGTIRHRMNRLGNALFGLQPTAPLADPKLETLRRFVCATRREGRAAEEYVDALVGHGFNRRQIDALALLSA